MEKNTTGKDAAYPVLKAWLFYTLAVIMVMYFCVGYYGGIWLGALGIGLVGIIITSIFLLRNHQNPEECSDAGQVYGKIGLGLALYVCLAGVLTLLYKSLMPELFGESITSAPWYSRMRIIFPGYMVAFPAFYYICKRIRRTPAGTTQDDFWAGYELHFHESGNSFGRNYSWNFHLCYVFI